MDRRKSLVCDNTLEDGSPSLTSLQRTFLAALFIFVATVVNSDAQTLPAGARPTNDEADLDVIVRAGGLLNPSEDTGGAGASLGLQFVPNEKWFFDVQFSLSGNNDLTGSQADFGSYVLNPSTDGMGFHGQARYVIESPFAVSGGFGGSGTAWEAMVGPDGDLTKTRFEGFILYGNVALQIATQVKDGGDDKNKIWLGIEIGPAFRTFGGDLGLMGRLQSIAEGARSRRHVLYGLAGHRLRGTERSDPALCSLHSIRRWQHRWSVPMAMVSRCRRDRNGF